MLALYGVRGVSVSSVDSAAACTARVGERERGCSPAAHRAARSAKCALSGDADWPGALTAVERSQSAGCEAIANGGPASRDGVNGPDVEPPAGRREMASGCANSTAPPGRPRAATPAMRVVDPCALHVQ